MNRDVMYKNVDGVELKMNLYYPPNWSENSPKLPAVIFFFGGGWQAGNCSQFVPQSTYLAERGMIAICADYRVAKRQNTTPDKCLEDAKSAMRFLYQNADDLGIDANKIAAGGGSAGGHLAACTYFCEGFNATTDNMEIKSKPAALVLCNPVIDNGPTGYGYDRVQAYWEQFSPMHNIGENTLPVLFLIGDKDQWIPVATAEEFRDRINSHGGNCKLIVYPEAAHGFFNPVTKGEKSPFHELTVEAIDDFFVEIGYLDAKQEL